MTTLEELTDWRAIVDLSIRYATGIDTRDWVVYRDCFTDEVRVDFSSFSRQPARATPTPAEEFVHTVRSLIERFESTQHLMTNQVVVVDGDECCYTAAVQAQHWMTRDKWYTVGGWYDNRARRVDAGWKITECVLHQTWDAGDRGLLGAASRRQRSRHGG